MQHIWVITIGIISITFICILALTLRRFCRPTTKFVASIWTPNCPFGTADRHFVFSRLIFLLFARLLLLLLSLPALFHFPTATDNATLLLRRENRYCFLTLLVPFFFCCSFFFPFAFSLYFYLFLSLLLCLACVQPVRFAFLRFPWGIFFNICM